MINTAHPRAPAHRDHCDDVPALAPFRGKRLHGNLMGNKMTEESERRQELADMAKAHGFRVYLPGPEGYTNADVCDLRGYGLPCRQQRLRRRRRQRRKATSSGW